MVVGVISATCGIFALLYQTNIVFQTEVFMAGVPNDCYVYFPDPKIHDPTTAQAIYYVGMMDGINKTGIKYLGPFLRSAAFQQYVFTHCEFLNMTHKYSWPQKYNSSLGSPNDIIPPSNYVINLESSEQSFMNYDFNSNPKNYTHIEQLAQDYNMTLPHVTDQLFLHNAMNIDNCKNPSWRWNSTIRQCQFHDTIYVVDKNTFDLLGIFTPPFKP